MQNDNDDSNNEYNKIEITVSELERTIWRIGRVRNRQMERKKERIEGDIDVESDREKEIESQKKERKGQRRKVNDTEGV